MNIPFISDLGDFAVVPNFQGEWEFKNVYVAGSLVSYKGKLYEARTLVDQSNDAVQIRHDDFHRESDIADGWGTASDGTEWVTVLEYAVGGAHILNNQGVIKYTDAVPNYFTFLQSGSDELSSANIEVLLKFSVAGEMNFFHKMNCRLFDSTTFAAVTLLNAEVYDEFFLEIQSFNDDNDILLDNYTSSNLPVMEGVTYTERIRISGSQLSLKVWQQSLSEPSEWDVTFLSPIPPLGNFLQIGFWPFNSTTTALQVSEFTVLALPDAPDINTTDWLLIG